MTLKTKSGQDDNTVAEFGSPSTEALYKKARRGGRHSSSNRDSAMLFVSPPVTLPPPPCLLSFYFNHSPPSILRPPRQKFSFLFSSCHFTYTAPSCCIVLFLFILLHDLFFFHFHIYSSKGLCLAYYILFLLFWWLFHDNYNDLSPSPFLTLSFLYSLQVTILSSHVLHPYVSPTTPPCISSANSLVLYLLFTLPFSTHPPLR